MSFFVDPDHRVWHIELPLPAYTTIRVPPMCMATIPHRIRVTPNGASPPAFQIWLMRNPEAWAELNLIVDTGVIDPTQDVVTRVFNLSNRSVKIERGKVISYLVSILVG